MRLGFWIGAGMALAVAATAGLADEPPAEDDPPAVVLRVVHPEKQLARMLKLFEGSRAPHPAAALAAWRRATDSHETLSKPAQALIALFNPAMISELRLLDEMVAELSTGKGPEGWSWWAAIPHDDGTLAALATAMALTDGQAEPALGPARVDRLGPAGSVLMARRSDGALAVAPNREALAAAFEDLDEPHDPITLPDGLHLWLNPLVTPAKAPVPLRQVSAGFDAGGCRRVKASAWIDADLALVARIRGAFDAPPPAVAPVDPSWLDWVPARVAEDDDQVAAAVVVALDSSRESWNRVFTVADRVEKANPRYEKAAPVRVRLNLAGLALGVRLERDLLPLLRGMTAGWTTDGEDRSSGWFVVLHAKDEAAASQILDRVAVPGAKKLGAPAPSRRDASVLIASSEALGASATAAASGEAPSEAATLRTLWEGQPSVPSRLGAVWPGRFTLSTEPLRGSREARAPIVWAGGEKDRTSWDVARWSGLKDLVHKTLERLPMEPPPGEPED